MKAPDYCFYCHKFIRPQHLTRDHFIPRSRKGPNHRRNIVRACRSCNEAKGALNPKVAFQLEAPQPNCPQDVENLERLCATVRHRATEQRYKAAFERFHAPAPVRYGDVSVRITDLLPELAQMAERAG